MRAYAKEVGFFCEIGSLTICALQSYFLVYHISLTWRISHTLCAFLAMSWTLDGLRSKFGDNTFTINCPGKKSVDMSLSNYLDYMHQQHDEDPMYLFDAVFGETAPELLDSYEVPAVFHDDFYDVLGTGDWDPYLSLENLRKLLHVCKKHL